jgi:hypothetical protein
VRRIAGWKSCPCNQFIDADQIVSRSGEGEGPSDPIHSSELGSCLTGDDLDLAERFRCTGGSCSPVSAVLASIAGRSYRRTRLQSHTHRAQFVDEVGRGFKLRKFLDRNDVMMIIPRPLA